MNSVKLNKKHLFSFFITLVLLIALNINTFASSDLVSFYDYNFKCIVTFSDNTLKDVTSETTKKRSSDTAPNGRKYTRYDFNSLLYSNVKYIGLYTGADLNLYTNTEFEYDFQIKISDSIDKLGVNVTLYIDDISSTDNDSVITLYDDEGNPKSGDNWHNVKGTFSTPSASGSYRYAMLVILGDEEGSKTIYDNIFYISDMHIVPTGPLYGEEIAPPNDETFTDSLESFKDNLDNLPTINGEEVADILADNDLFSYNDTFFFVGEMFETLINLANFNSILVLALSIGFATFFIGRKVG